MFSHRSNHGSTMGGLAGLSILLAVGWAFANMAEIPALVRFAA